jgi:A/G-specific adenine glycosylase
MRKQFELKGIKIFQQKILDWYAENQRDLPWRKTRDPYHILVSEVMLQQTQVSRVIPKYNAWFEKFSTVKDLAEASVSDVLLMWSGLGYNRRALHLKKTAEILVKEYDCLFPQDEKILKKFPGIGDYTARALLCFAFDRQVAVVDTNVRKVILTEFLKLYHSETVCLMTNNEIQIIANQLLPEGKASIWNQALMDYSSAVLREQKIPIPKQSKFLGSHRYYRGQVLKILLQKKNVLIEDLGFLIKKDYTHADCEWLDGLVLELQKEGFVDMRDGTVMLVSRK